MTQSTIFTIKLTITITLNVGGSTMTRRLIQVVLGGMFRESRLVLLETIPPPHYHERPEEKTGRGIGNDYCV